MNLINLSCVVLYCTVLHCTAQHAFDNVDHPIMLQVLHDRFCVKNTALKWF